MGVMYDVPSNENAAKCIVNENTIINKEQPVIIEGESQIKGIKKAAVKKTNKLKKGTESVS